MRAPLFCRAQCFEFATHHSLPGQIVSAGRESWCAVGLGVLEVELVRELVRHQVCAIGGIGRSAFRFIPCQHHRSELQNGVTETEG